MAQIVESTRDIKKPVALTMGAQNRVLVTAIDAVPKGLGFNYKKREEWEKLYASGLYTNLLEDAKRILKKGFPPFDQKKYLSYFSGENTSVGKEALDSRIRALSVCVWAECLENKGNYIKFIESALLELCNQKSWVYPSSDTGKQNFLGKKNTIDLSSASYAHNIAQAIFLLDDKINSELKKVVLETLKKRITEPTFKLAMSNATDKSWLTKTSNWNAVCLAGVTGAVLTTSNDIDERKQIIQIAEEYSKNFISGFLDDGYCSEGIDYYNYGFGNFLVLREVILRNSNGQIDLLSNVKIKNMASFLSKMEILNSKYPSIGDCSPNVKPSYFVLNYLFQDPVYYKLGRAYPIPPVSVSNINLTQFVFLAFNKNKKASENLVDLPVNSSFKSAGVYIFRPTQHSDFKLGVAIKGGNNNEYHNHNDLGSYTIVLNDEFLIVDPGNIPYTNQTFGKNRYQAKTLSSYGHPVPRIDGVLQSEGISAKAVVKKLDMSELLSEVSFDLVSAYNSLKNIKDLTRSFIYDRKGETLVVLDKFSFLDKHSYETALITRANISQVSANKFLLAGKNQQLLVEVDAKGKEITMTKEVINEGKNPYTRVAFKFKEPVASGEIKILYRESKK